MNLHIRFLEKVVALLLIPVFIALRHCRSNWRHVRLFRMWSEVVGLLPFQMGGLVRRVFYQHTLRQCGVNPVIKMGAIFVHPQAELGNNVFIGYRCTIGLATLGNDTMVGQGAHILGGRQHHPSTFDDVPRRLQSRTIRRVYIGRNVWIGANATVMDDVGDHAVIGAGAVVVSPVPQGATAVGNPARVLPRPLPGSDTTFESRERTTPL